MKLSQIKSQAKAFYRVNSWRKGYKMRDAIADAVAVEPEPFADMLSPEYRYKFC